jgi:hypothetical protein
MIQSFLLLGQSNMAGRGFLKDVPPIYNEHIKMLRNGRWQTMSEPINYDRPTAGIGPAASFAAAWHLHHDTEEIGLIPCADGGTSLQDWAVGGALFDHAVCQAKLAQRTSQLAGMLWHQGENDCSVEGANQYGEKFSSIVEAFRQELNTSDLPLIVGGLGGYLTSGRYGAYFTNYSAVNHALQTFAATTPNCYFVTAAGLAANPDGLHLDAASQRLFGIRYFEAFHTHQHLLAPLGQENSMLNRINSRPLSKVEQIALLELTFASGRVSLAEFEGQLATINQIST